jgi:maleylpyruvate isomerase
VKLYTYYRSSAAYRVRIALAIKGIAYESAPVHLVKGEQLAPAYTALNPQALVPALEDGAERLTQSLAIVEYLDETHPRPALLPADAPGRARVRALALAVACEIHPLNNRRVLEYLRGRLGADEAAIGAWYRHWVVLGLEALEAAVRQKRPDGAFCHGAAPTLADVCLVPQLYNARRFAVDVAPFRTLLAIEAACLALPAFRLAAPENQPDAQ